MSAQSVRHQLREVLLETRHVADRIAKDLASDPPQLDAARDGLAELHTLFDRNLQQVYKEVFAGPDRTISGGFQVASAPPVSLPNMADAMTSIVPSTVRLSRDDEKDELGALGQLVDVLRAHLRIWSQRMDEIPGDADAVMAAIRALGPMPGRVEMMERMTRSR